jgi:hypothetical protein
MSETVLASRQLWTASKTTETFLVFVGVWDSWEAGSLHWRTMPLGMIDAQAILRRWTDAGSKLDERRRRLFAAGEAGGRARWAC